MKLLKAFKYRLIPTGPQVAAFRRTLGACRFVWNRALAEQQRRFDAKEKRFTFPAACRELAVWRQSAETPWLAETASAAQQQTLKDLERAFQNLFAKRARRPRFRRRGDDSGFRFAVGFAVDTVNGRVKVPKLGWVRFRNHRRLEGKPKQMTISSRAGRWYVSVQVELEVPEPKHHAPNAAVGVDAGVVHFATLSTGEHLAPLVAFKKHEKCLAWQQRKLARKQKGSNNFAQQKRVVQRAHARMADARADFLHQASHRLTRDFGIIAIEDLDVRSMTRSARGAVDAPGRNVRAKSGLNKALLNHGLGEFRRQLEYKAAWRGGVVIAVPPHHTSQTCPACGVVDAESRQSQSDFCCVACGHAANADVVAARNILGRAFIRSTSLKSGARAAGAGRGPPEAPVRRAVFAECSITSTEDLQQGSVGRNHSAECEPPREVRIAAAAFSLSSLNTEAGGREQGSPRLRALAVGGLPSPSSPPIRWKGVR